MLRLLSALFALCLLVSFGLAKDKTKSILPAYVLRARTVAVIIAPGAGVSIDDPQANQVAQKDVETALLNWGRFDPVLATQSADLIIVVRKGHARAVDETIPNPRQSNRAGVINPYDNGISVGGQHGPRPVSPDGSASDSGPSQAPEGPQTEIGGAEDSFAVYEGGVKNPLDAPPAWRYVAKDGLLPHSVPAVAAFKKAVADAEKAAAKKP
jgi:hypothetical protein